MARNPKKRSARVAPRMEAVSQQESANVIFSEVKAAAACGEALAGAEKLAAELERSVNAILSAHAASLDAWQIGALEHLRTEVACGRAQLIGHQSFILVSAGLPLGVDRG